jgi:Ser/Thr protein kinase RdoA (MazF antagonist)
MQLQSHGPGDLYELVSLWNGDCTTVRSLGLSQNHQIFSFRADERDLILRLTPQSHRDSQHVEEELAWVRYLGDHGVRVCQPVQSKKGIWVETLDRPVHNPYVAVAMRKALGVRISSSNASSWGGGLFREWGRTAARIHSLSAGFVPQSGFRRHVLDGAALSEHAFQVLPRSQQRAARIVRQLWEEIRTSPIEPDCYGMIHGDMTAGNLFIIDGEIEMCDFDNCGFAWFIYDIAIILHITMLNLFPCADFREKFDFFVKQFFLGYATEKRLPPFWLDRLPLFISFFNALVYVSLFQNGVPNENGQITRFVEMHLNTGGPALDLDFTKVSTSAT